MRIKLDVERSVWKLLSSCLSQFATTASRTSSPSGRFRNSGRGVQPLAREALPQIFWLPRPLLVTLEVRTEYLEATLGLVKCLEISKELIGECVTMPGCCCCMPLLHNHLIDSCSYVRKNRLLAAKGGCICTPLTPPESATESSNAIEVLQGSVQQLCVAQIIPMWFNSTCT